MKFRLKRFPDPDLHLRCAPVEIQEFPIYRAMVNDLRKYCKHLKGFALAANQVGIQKRFFVLGSPNHPVLVKDNEWMKKDHDVALIMFNPVIREATNPVTIMESCLSISDLSGKHPQYPLIRPGRILLSWEDGTGRYFEREANGMFARVVQHEMDHLDGKLFVDQLQGDAASKARTLLAEVRSRASDKNRKRHAHR
jgi:peptide deformylase